jgi:hypothetical protein
MPQHSKTHIRLSDPSLSFAAKLRLAVSFELEYWEGRTDPPNIPIATFRVLILAVPDTIMPTWKPRKSTSGEHGMTGEDVVFNFEFNYIAMGKSISFYCKGYFFDKEDLKGVTIQSFRAVSGAKVVNIRRNMP